jgi:TonB-linked SusC/RagA family outer membrane protein
MKKHHPSDNLSRRVFLFLFAMFATLTSWGQITVTGTVVDETQIPVPGATVVIKGETTTGTITDFDGNFSITVKDQSAVLVISFIGYVTQEIPVGSNTVLNVVLKEDAITLNEVVAIGYATVKKSDLTGSVEKVNMDEMNKTTVTSFDQALGGRVAGVQVVSGSGQPGEEANIVIRGSNTISDTADGNPLYVIDGFATEDANAASINPNDIESIDILKDASATAIYGARGANGVVIITTKRGQESAPRITYDGYIAYQTRPKFLELLQGREFVELQQEIMSDSDIKKTYFCYDEALGRHQTIKDYDNRISTNWQDKVFQAAPMTSHHLSISGGSQKTKYSASISYLNQQGTIIESSFESIKARLTLDQQLTDNLKFGASVNFANNVSTGSAPSEGGGQSTQYFLYQVLAYRPVKYKSTDDLDKVIDDNGGTYPYNPVKTIENTFDKLRKRQLNFNTYLNWNINKDLMFKATFAYTWREDRTRKFYNSDTYYGDPTYSASRTNGSFNYKEWNSWSNEYTLNYKKKLNSHYYNAMIGASLSSQQISNLGAKSVMIPWEELGFWGIDAGSAQSVTSDNVKNTMMSFFARFNYDWKSRYLVTATMRADGSSKFIKNKWGYFPSASFAWRISDEPFMVNIGSWLTSLKLRIGWGATGNNATQYNYPSHQLYSGNLNYAFNNSLSPGIYMYQMANKDLKWETTYQTNFGIDFGIMNNRINGSIDIYDKTTRDLLLYADVPASIGFTQVQQNIGSINNRGLEFTINSTNLPGGGNKLEWKTSFNISFNKNKITALSDGQLSRMAGIRYPSIDNLYICKVGEPLSEMYGYIYDGVYQYEDFNEVAPGVYVLKPEIPNNTNERSAIQPGDPKLKDLNGDGKVTVEDQTVIGHGLPIHTGGLTNTFSWKNFDLSVFFQWSYGNDVINYNRVKLESLNDRHINQLATVKDHWTPNNPTNYLWAPGRGLTNISTNREVEDASFLRLKNVQLGYNFPIKLLKGTGLSSLRVYFTAQNLWTWTKYTGYDPEVSTRNSAMTRGFDYSAYPRATTYTLGVKFGL